MRNLTEIRRVLRHREFRFLWLAQSSSVIGDYLVTVALALFIVQRTGSATDLGLVLAAKALPLIVFLLIGGVWADRLPRHRVMIATDLIRFSLHALLATLIFAGSVPIWQIVAIEMAFGGAEAFFRPAADGLLPQTVPDEDIQQARAITAMSNNIAEFAGPALATALVLGAGAGWAFALDAATFLASATFLRFVRPRRREQAIGVTAAESEAAGAPSVEAQADPAAPATEPDAGLLAEIKAGSREVRARTWVWATLLTFCAALFFGLAPWLVLGPVIARSQYGHISVFGLLEAAVGLGTIAGALIAITWRPRFPMRTAMLTIMAWPVAAVLYAAKTPLWIVMPAAVVAGAGIAVFDVNWTTALAERIPPARLSRVSSYDWMVSGALLPLGYALAGPLGSAIGAVPVMLGGSALAMSAFLLGLLPRETRSLARLEVHETRRGGQEESVLGLTHRH